MPSRRKGSLKVGDTVGLLTITGSTTHGKSNEFHWECRCECGSDKRVLVRNGNLLNGIVMSCGCYRASRINKSGLGKGREIKCAACGSDFISKSTKQIVCSTECRFVYYETRAGNDECWNWAGPTNSQNYGVLFLNQNKENGRREVTSAHRYSFATRKEAIPDGLCVMHTCDNTLCTNPDHLVLGTWADNNEDRSKKGRSGTRIYTDADKANYSMMFRGEGSNNSKLTEDQARKIKFEYLDEPSSAVAKRFGVSKAAVKSIRSGRTWKHILRTSS